MADIVVDCPVCGRKIGSINENMRYNGERMCPGCKEKKHINYDPRTKHISVGPA